MTEIEHLSLIARLQFRNLGLISTSIVMRLAALGVDVAALEDSFADEEG